MHWKHCGLAVIFFSFGLTQAARAGSYDDFIQALRNDQVVVLHQLQLRQFDFNTPDENGVSPLMVALRSNSLRVAEFLIRQPQMDLDAVNASDENALMFAALHGNMGILRQLLHKGAEPNKPGWTPLHYAASNNHPISVEVIEMLLDYNAYIDAESPNQTTPLMMAARYGYPATVKLLLEAGADVSLHNEKGLTAVDFAQASHRTEVVQMLRAWNASQALLPTTAVPHVPVTTTTEQ